MQVTSKEAVLRYLRDVPFRTVLDAPSGDGWLRHGLGPEMMVDGVDLFASAPGGYRKFWKHDLDEGLPADCSGYDLICCCEGIEHVGNPLRLLRSIFAALAPGGRA